MTDPSLHPPAPAKSGLPDPGGRTCRRGRRTGGVYGFSALTRNAGATPPASRRRTGRQTGALAHGEVAPVNMAKTPLKLPDLAFNDAAGAPVTLAHWRGRTVLLNLWATWCVPCRKEMRRSTRCKPPRRARLRGGGGEHRHRDPGKPKAFSRRSGAQTGLFRRSECRGVPGFEVHRRAFGMPTTVLVDPHGCEIGTSPALPNGERRRGQTDPGRVGE